MKALPAETSEALVLSVPSRPLKPTYRDSDTGKRHIDLVYLLPPLVAICVIGECIAFNIMDSLSESSMVIFINCMAALALFFLALQVLAKNRITLSQQGYKLVQGSLFRWQRLGSISHDWSELECIRYQPAARASIETIMQSGRGDSLVFDWRGERPWYKAAGQSFPTCINLWHLSETEKIKLFLSIAKYVPQELLAPEVLYLQVKTLSGESSAGWDDYTKVWLDEYNRKFEMPNYIALTPGTTIGGGRFTIGMTIAGRVNSSTYLAASSTGERMVIKELVVPIGSDDEVHKKMLEQFNREATTLAKLSHPAIVRVVDHFIENNRSYIVMEHVSGKNLREYVRLQGTVPKAQALKIAIQLAEVLRYLHHNTPPLLHRDFTPDNLICDREGNVTVIDFGAANVFDAGKTATLIGKQKYMPPEQLRGKPSPASDIYSFGATMGFILSGEDMPGMGHLPLETLNATAGADLCGLISSCVKLDELDRPNIDEIITRLKSVESN